VHIIYFSSLRDEIANFIDDLAKNPIQGDRITTDCYKIRTAIASKGKGKSGGARIITCVKIEADNVFLLTIYDKGEQSDISNQDLSDMLDTYDLE
jgi:hypothetical protein